MYLPAGTGGDSGRHRCPPLRALTGRLCGGRYRHGRPPLQKELDQRGAGGSQEAGAQPSPDAVHGAWRAGAGLGEAAAGPAAPHTGGDLRDHGLRYGAPFQGRQAGDQHQPGSSAPVGL